MGHINQPSDFDPSDFDPATTLRVLMPRDASWIWQIILDLDAEDHGFRYEDIRRCAPEVHHAVINQYLSRLKKGGYIYEVKIGLDGSSRYELRRPQPEPPRLKVDGTPERQWLARDQMWRAMKMLNWWRPKDLAIAASTERCPISEGTAKSYASHLFLAHLLGWRREAGVYRLRPGADTGPAPPRVMRTTFVWDGNRRCIVGSGTKTEEVKL